MLVLKNGILNHICDNSGEYIIYEISNKWVIKSKDKTHLMLDVTHCPMCGESLKINSFILDKNNMKEIAHTIALAVCNKPIKMIGNGDQPYESDKPITEIKVFKDRTAGNNPDKSRMYIQVICDELNWLTLDIGDLARISNHMIELNIGNICKRTILY